MFTLVLTLALTQGAVAGDEPQEPPAAADELVRNETAAPLSLSLGGRHRLAVSSGPDLPTVRGQAPAPFAADDGGEPRKREVGGRHEQPGFGRVRSHRNCASPLCCSCQQ